MTTERANIPSSPACGGWETLLAEALDGLLKPEDETFFNAHMAACPACTALFEEARRGREWLGFLAAEPEVPAGLLDKILAQTGPGQVAGYGLLSGDGVALPMPEPWQRRRPGFMGQVYAQVLRFSQPRLLMTAAMAFFSIALTLNLTNVRIGALRLSDLRPSAMRSFMERRLTTASTPIIRYYDHLRFVYEVESTMREFRRNSQGDQISTPKPKDSAPGESRQNPDRPDPARKDGGSRIQPPLQSVTPARNDSEFLETSLTFQLRPAHSGGSQMDLRERSTLWTA